MTSEFGMPPAHPRGLGTEACLPALLDVSVPVSVSVPDEADAQCWITIPVADGCRRPRKLSLFLPLFIDADCCRCFGHEDGDGFGRI